MRTSEARNVGCHAKPSGTAARALSRNSLKEAFEHVRGPILWHMEALDIIGKSNPNRVPLEERLHNENYRDGLRWAYVDAEA